MASWKCARLYHALVLRSGCDCPKKDKVNIWDASGDTTSSNRKRRLRTMNFRHLISRSRAEVSILSLLLAHHRFATQEVSKKCSPWRKFTSNCLFSVQPFPLVRHFSLHDFLSTNSLNCLIMSSRFSDCEHEGHSCNCTTSRCELLSYFSTCFCKQGTPYTYSIVGAKTINCLVWSFQLGSSWVAHVSICYNEW